MKSSQTFINNAVKWIHEAPNYQTMPILHDDPVWLRRILHARNTKSIRTSTKRYTIIPELTEKKVIDAGCNTGFFAFASNPLYYQGFDNDKKAWRAAMALARIRDMNHIRFGCSGFECLDCGNIKSRSWDVALYLSTYHHRIGIDGYDVARKELRKLSRLAPTMFFDMGQKDEPTNQARRYWHSQLPDREPHDFITDEILTFSEYMGYELIGDDRPGERLLYRFFR